MSEVPTSVEVFCSYAHEDEVWLRKLETHLSLLRRQGLLSLWHDRLIVPGTNWAQAIDVHLETASVILLLVGDYFFAYEYCIGNEMKRALKRQEDGSAVVIPILISETNWRDAPFVHLQALPTDAKPLTTWPDEETALIDVAAGIRRAVETLPLLAASAPRAALPPIWNIPYPRNPFFLGRETELAQVRSHLQRDQTTALSQPQAISGLGGVGKTQIAVEYAYRYHQDYQAILWLSADTREALISGYIANAHLLNLPQKDEQDQTKIVQAFLRWLTISTDWLLILDNADELMLVREFLPPGFSGHLLLTTRAQVIGRLAQRIEVNMMDPDVGILLLLRRAGLVAHDALLEEASPSDCATAREITKELGGLPLALDQAGAYIEETSCSLADYLSLYRTRRAELLSRRGGYVDDHPEPVAATWSLSFQKVEQKSPIAADLLRLCAFLFPDVIPEKIITKGAVCLGPYLSIIASDLLYFNDAILILRNYSLIQRDSSILRIHRLVQVVLRDAMDDHKQQEWILRIAKAISDTFPDMTSPENWQLCEQYLPNMLICIEQAKNEYIDMLNIAKLHSQAGVYLHARGQYSEAGLHLEKALKIREEQLGLNHQETASSLNDLGGFYRTQARCREAELSLLQALQIREQLLGPNDLDVAQSLHILGELYRAQSRYEEAEPLLQRALQIREQKLDPWHPDLASSLVVLALLYRTSGEYRRAEPLQQRALWIREQKLGLDHPHMAQSLYALGGFFRALGRYKEAEPLLQRALQIREQKLGLNHPETAQSLNSVAKLYDGQGKYEAAEQLYRRSLEIREQNSGPESWDMAQGLNSLATFYVDQRRYKEAESMYRRALQIWKKTMGAKYSDVGQSLGTQALQILERVLGLHPDVARSLSNLAVLYQIQNEDEEAEPLLLRALQIREQVFGRIGVEYPDIVQSLNNLAELYRSQGRYGEAEPLLKRVLAIGMRVLSQEHPHTQTAQRNYATLLQTMGLDDEAKEKSARNEFAGAD